MIHRRRIPILIAATFLGIACSGSEKSATPPNLLLVTLDTTRVDHLGCYGYERATSPNLDRLAREGVVVERAYSSSSWTLPAHASLFTGQPVAIHRVLFDPDGPLVIGTAIENDPMGHLYRARRLSSQTPTLAGLLRDSGFHTAGFAGGPWMKRVFGLASGFAHYDDVDITSLAGRSADRITDRALAWLDGVPGEPFFLFLNYYDPHLPYVAPPEFTYHFVEPPRGKALGLDQLVGLYDGQIRFMDHHFGRLLDALRERGIYDRTWIIVTADHGEALSEHGHMGHAQSLYEEEIRIPLVIKYPRHFGDRPAAFEQDRVSITEILPALLETLGLEIPSTVRAVASALRTGEAPPPVIAELHPIPAIQRGGDWRALIAGDYKLLWNSEGRHRLYDIARDPGETLDRADLEPERMTAMNERLEALLARLPAPEFAEDGEFVVDEDTRRALESLGYLGEPPAALPEAPESPAPRSDR